MANRTLTAAPVATASEAKALAAELRSAVAELGAVVAEETDLLKVSDLRRAAEMAERKTDAGHRYVAALEAVKTNGVALARWAPAEIDDLKRAHDRLAAALDYNMTVLATAQAVSENIMRSLAREIGAAQALTTYGAPGSRPPGQTRPAAEPLVFSRRL